jgi:hypothetical protein
VTRFVLECGAAIASLRRAFFLARAPVAFRRLDWPSALRRGTCIIPSKSVGGVPDVRTDAGHPDPGVGGPAPGPPSDPTRPAHHPGAAEIPLEQRGHFSTQTPSYFYSVISLSSNSYSSKPNPMSSKINGLGFNVTTPTTPIRTRMGWLCCRCRS